jgi:hypothetical protein
MTSRDYIHDYCPYCGAGLVRDCFGLYPCTCHSHLDEREFKALDEKYCPDCGELNDDCICFRYIAWRTR